MNQRGEMNLFFVLMVVCLSGVMILCALKLQRSFRLLEKRTELFLCMKETEGEMVDYMKFMGRTNLAIKNVKIAQMILMFIPGAQGMALKAREVKRVMIRFQNLHLVLHLKKLSELKSRGCPLDPRMLRTPFELTVHGYMRSADDTAKLRSKKWTHYYVSLPYTVSVDWNVAGYASVWPIIGRVSSEKTAKLSSILSSY